MNLRSHARLEATIAAAKSLAVTLRQIGQLDEAEAVEQMVTEAREERLLIGVAGASKRGKSTLVNAILGREDDLLAPTGRFPATNVVSMFAWAPTLAVRVHFEDDARKPIDIRPEEIRSYACEEGNPANEKSVQRIEVEGPFPGLDEQLGLMDLPGADNAAASQHAQILFRSLSQVQAIVFLISADDPINAAEQELLKLVRKSDASRFIFVLNKCDLVEDGELTAAELQEGLNHNRSILASVGFPGVPILQLSALKAMNGTEGSGIAELASAIRESIASQRLDIVADTLDSRLARVKDLASTRAAEALAIARMDESDLTALKEQVGELRVSLSQGKQERITRFRSDSSDALRVLDDSVDRLTRQLQRDYLSLIDSKGNADIPELASSIHADLDLAVREGLSAPMSQCQEALDRASETLASSGPRVNMQDLVPSSPAATAGSRAVDALRVPIAVAPGVLLSGFTLALPPLMGGAMSAAAGGSWVGMFVGGLTQAAVLPLLTVVTVPLGLGAIGWAAYRGFRAFQHGKTKDRNALKSAVCGMLDGVRDQVRDETHRLRGEIPARLDQHFAQEESRLASLSKQLASRLHTRPTSSQLEALTANEALIRALPCLEPATEECAATRSPINGR